MAIAIQAERSHADRSLDRALAAARTAENNRGRDIVVLDLRELTCVFDYFVLVTGTSRRQLHAISEEIDQVLSEQFDDRRLGIEGFAESRWILLDFGDVVIHMFDDETRRYYDLENLWSGRQTGSVRERTTARRRLTLLATPSRLSANLSRKNGPAAGSAMGFSHFCTERLQ